MAAMLKTQGCASRLTHLAHTWKPTIRWPRGGVAERWCPGRVRCVKCRRAVFTTMATPLPGSTNQWICTSKC